MRKWVSSCSTILITYVIWMDIFNIFFILFSISSFRKFIVVLSFSIQFETEENFISYTQFIQNERFLPLLRYILKLSSVFSGFRAHNMWLCFNKTFIHVLETRVTLTLIFTDVLIFTKPRFVFWVLFHLHFGTSLTPVDRLNG